MDEASLRTAVEDQAKARVSGDLATFASYMTSQALVSLHRLGQGPRGARRIRRFRVTSATVDGARGESEVRYLGAGAHILRTSWEYREGAWKAFRVEGAGPGEPPWWRRIPFFAPREYVEPERRDLS